MVTPAAFVRTLPFVSTNAPLTDNVSEILIEEFEVKDAK